MIGGSGARDARAQCGSGERWRHVTATHAAQQSMVLEGYVGHEAPMGRQRGDGAQQEQRRMAMQ